MTIDEEFFPGTGSHRQSVSLIRRTEMISSLMSLNWKICICLAVSIAGIVLYSSSLNAPVWILVPIFVGLAISFLRDGFHGRVYSFMGVLLFFLPFLHTVGFLFSDEYLFFSSYDIAVPDQLNPVLRSQLTLSGLVGICGLIGGVLTSQIPTSSSSSSQSGLATGKNTGAGSSGILVTQILALYLAYLDSPLEIIFVAAYSEVSTRAFDIGLGSLFPISFGLNLLGWLAYLNARKEKFEHSLSLVVLVVTTLMIVIFFQLLRGDREFVGLLIALLFLADRYSKIHKQTASMLVWVAVAFLVLQFVGFFRSVAVDDSDFLSAAWTYLSSGELFVGTWTAALLTPLSTLGDFHFGMAHHLLGKTYADYILSLPPTPVAEWFGYERPITSFQGPSWDVTYGIGGTNITVVPFLNFSMFGVLVQTYLVGLFLGYIDRFSYQGRIEWTIMGFAVGSVLWGVMWYGEMYLLRAVTTTFPILLGAWYLFFRKL